MEAICAILSGFHFDVGDPYDSTVGEESVVWKALESRIIPRIEELFMKQKTGKTGEKIGLVRPQVILGLAELYKKLPDGVLERKLPRLITVLSDALKSRDSNARDLARTTLARLSTDVGLRFLPDILRELAVTLREGYQLHVRAAAVHSILLQTWETCFNSGDGQLKGTRSDIDTSVPALMDLLQRDLFGNAQDRRNAEFNQVRYVKEAGGSKSLHSLELIAQMICINKTQEKHGNVGGHQGGVMYCLVSPLLNRILHDAHSMKQLRLVKECLGRVVQGLSNNATFTTSIILPIVYATIDPYMKRGESLDRVDAKDEANDERGSGLVTEWRPSCSDVSSTALAARDDKMHSERMQNKVRDGIDAPKLTGSWRRSTLNVSITAVDDPGSTIAVIFGLQLLRYAIRGGTDGVVSEELDPFVPLLTECVCRCRDSEAILLAMRCLSDLGNRDAPLPSFETTSNVLASKTLELLAGYGGNEELLQAGFKMMAHLLQVQKIHGRMVLNEEQMELLLSILQTSLEKANQHNPALDLTRILVARQVISPGMYDLMGMISKLSIQSHKETLRQQAAVLYVRFLMSYPLSTERLAKELKQLVVNIQFDGVDGRQTAISMIGSVLTKFPDPLIIQHCRLFFLPLTMQLGNDESEKGRRAISECLSTLFSRLPPDILQSDILDYLFTWGASPDQRLRRASLSVLGVFVDCSVIKVNVDTTVNRMVDLAVDTLDPNNDWEVTYFALLLLEKLNGKFPDTVGGTLGLWPKVVSYVSGCHPWVGLVSLRLLFQHLQSLDPCEFVANQATSFLQERGNLFLLSSALCSFLEGEEDGDSDDAVAIVIKALTFTLKASNKYPLLCFPGSDTEDSKNKTVNPMRWLIMRLSQIAKPKGPKRRKAVFKCFAAFAKYGNGIAFDFLDLMIEPLYRVERESRNETEMNNSKSGSMGGVTSEESQLAQEVLHLLEELCPSHEKFVDAYGAVKHRAQEKKMKRSEEYRIDAARDPKIAAKRKVEKQIREKERRKRRIEERASSRDRHCHRRTK